MKKLILILIFMWVSILFADNIIQRGVNKQLEYISATGNGSDTLPYKPIIEAKQDTTKVRDFYLEVAQGNISGYSSVNKFGNNPAVATTGEDVWSGGGTYDFYPTSAEAMTIVSSSTDDDSGGPGAWEVVIYGLDENWLEVSETAILNGDSAVTLNNSYIRQFRCVVITCGDSGTNVGNITTNSDIDDAVGVYIAADDGQTQQAIYTVPVGKNAYFIKGYVAMGNNTFQGESAEFKWQGRLNNGVNGAWATKGQVSLINIGNSYWIYKYGVPAGPFPEKTDIRILVSTATDVITAQAGFDLILVDN